AGRRVYLMVSKPARIVIASETDLALPGRTAEMERYLGERYGAGEDQVRVFGTEEWTAPVASGTGAPRVMVVCPCTMGTLSSIAVGASKNLIERAADVVLKESGKLILVPRETPLSAIHLANMLTLAKLGAIVLPANPGFYYRPGTVDDLVDFVVARVLDQVQVPHSLVPAWGETSGAER
ncbi:MAG TPA: flavin prenyltransferase UbiX, partial [Woeseiaceae bacterium]|nr:flavin prenyltransferase UbiX [Woeseiaceae bacterium]